ncbi:TolB family protein [Mucilaginibacter sp. FT3.2]|uniref:TolB family protein n=1 Tax=Mucilaginibacter sp. FT3.2 TaxID=2723090 RepID=UPI00160EF192|nr:PD40 domain-containing protein [Mucilaginibacter sp. FT3.2]MBB6234060.1 Tol biopolymer transport system component [Mucilaginibacter sp. FT3.2]
MRIKNLCAATCLLCFVFFSQKVRAQGLGIFDDQTDVGTIKHPGSAQYDAKTQQYQLSGSGQNIWATHDDFHFVWKRMKGDFILRTNAAFIGKGVELHRKVGLMVRSALDSNSTHINAVVHGDGLTSLQYRKTVGGITEEKKMGITAADVIQLERKGNTYTMSVARKGDLFVTQEVSDLNLGDDVYVGIFICAHNADVTENATFSNVRIVVPAPATLVPYKQYLGSSIELLNLETQNSTIIYQAPRSLQAPNWMKDGKSLIYNSEGLLYKYNLKTNQSVVLNTAPAKNNNNDHVLSFDGKMLAISSGDGGPSIGYTVPVTGGEAKRVSAVGVGASYMHGWSPDGKYIVFCGERNKEFDVYRIPSGGGPEERLTTSPGLDDGPEYTPDGKYIYFNSVRSGLMQVWRMKADGSEQTQITNDDYNNWFPHISPDGKWIVYITFYKNEVAPGDHPFYKHVFLRVMPIGGGPSKVVAYLYGGQGTINTPSWSPDSKHIAFVSNSNLLFPIFPVGK